MSNAALRVTHFSSYGYYYFSIDFVTEVIIKGAYVHVMDYIQCMILRKRPVTFFKGSWIDLFR